MKRNSKLIVAAFLLLNVSGISPILAAPTAGPSYTFTNSNPPLLKDFNGQILQLPDAALSQTFPTATWTQRDVIPKTGWPQWQINTSTFTMTRIRHWVISIYPQHFAVDTTLKVTTVVGYDETQATSMSKSLETQAGLSDFGLSVSVKSTLEITNGETQSWHNQTTTEVDKDYKAGTTYVTWELMDTLKLHKVESFSGQCCATTSGVYDNEVDIVESTYEDAATDQELEQVFPQLSAVGGRPSSSQQVKSIEQAQ